MRKEYKVLICILALIFSIGATCIGFGLIGSSSLKFGMKYVCDFVGTVMDGISSRKLTWGICIVGIAIAIISFFFLPEIIPVHFAGNGVADDFGNKTEIFLMPILLLAVTILSGIKSIKYVLMHSKTWLTVGQYNLMIDCVLGIILIAEIFMIYASFV